MAASVGCLVRRRPLERAERPASPLRDAGLEQLTEQVRQQYEAVETLTASVTLEPSVISSGKGEATDYKDVTGYILVRKPRFIRLMAQYPVVPGTAFDMVSDGRTFHLLIPSRNLLLTGQNEIEHPSTHKLEDLRPQYLLDALLVTPPGGGEQPVLENWTDSSRAIYILYMLRHDAHDNLHLSRKLWFDRATLDLVRQQMYDEHSELVTDVRYSGWNRRNGVLFPAQIFISRPQDEYELTIDFTTVKFNEPIAEDKFQLTPPPGIQVRTVGQTESSNAVSNQSND